MSKTISKSPKVKSYNKIRGWLILPAIGIVISTIISLDTILNKIYPIISNTEQWAYLTSPASEGYIPRFSTIVYYEFYAGLLMLMLLVWLLILFFKKHKLAPIFMIILLIVNIVFSFIDEMLALSILESINITFVKTIGAFFTATIWIPYFILSERVKGTFTQ